MQLFLIFFLQKVNLSFNHPIMYKKEKKTSNLIYSPENSH